jgi:hypothetical protein
MQDTSLLVLAKSMVKAIFPNIKINIIHIYYCQLMLFLMFML